MPEYRAKCAKCGSEYDYVSKIAERDESMKMFQCCDVPLRRILFPSIVDVVFQPGKYDVGLGNGPEYFRSQADMNQRVGEHNKANDKAGIAEEIKISRNKYSL